MDSSAWLHEEARWHKAMSHQQSNGDLRDKMVRQNIRHTICIFTSSIHIHRLSKSKTLYYQASCIWTSFFVYSRLFTSYMTVSLECFKSQWKKDDKSQWKKDDKSQWKKDDKSQWKKDTDCLRIYTVILFPSIKRSHHPQFFLSF